LVAEKNHLMLNCYGVYSGTGHVNSRFTLLRLFPYHKPNVLNFSRNVGRGFHIVGKNLVCFNCWPLLDSFPCEGLHLNFQWLAELLTSWTILLQELTVAYLLWFYIFCRNQRLINTIYTFWSSDMNLLVCSSVIIFFYTSLLTSDISLLYLKVFMFSQKANFICTGHKLLCLF